jgi:hypothetical protein
MRANYLIYILISSTLLIILPLAPALGQMPISKLQYLTIWEQTFFGQRIPLNSGDTLSGWMHSNDTIAIMQSPLFYGPVTTSASNFWQGVGYNPIFFIEPRFDYPEAELPEQFTGIRDQAEILEHFFSHPGYQYRILFQGAQGMVIYEWPEGLPFNDSLAIIVGQYPPPTLNGVFFIDSPLQMLGTDSESRTDYGIQGRYTIGCSNDIYILDNLRYIDSDTLNGMVVPNTWNCLGLASEGFIIIKNTWENGRDNGATSASEWRKDVIINGVVLALESFSFEDQNDVITAGGGTWPQWYYSNGPTPDERGQIHLWGTMAQYRRGYVHRSNHGGTGYLKDYHYYPGISLEPPPYFPTIPVELTFDNEHIYFDNVTVGDTTSETIAIFNACMDTVRVFSWSYSDSAFFGTCPVDSFFLPDSQWEVMLCFAPSAPANYDGYLNINTNYGGYAIDLHGEGEAVGFIPGWQNSPNSVELFISIKPNPFNHSALLEFTLPQAELLHLRIFDISGREVFDCYIQGDIGLNHFRWEPEMILGSGVYLYEIKGEGVDYRGKMLYLK